MKTLLRIPHRINWIALFAMGCACHPSPRTGTTQGQSPPLFESLPASYTGINFQNTLHPDLAFNILEYDYYYNGGGIAAADFNNDGLTDLYFTGNQVSGKLYLNKGQLTFEDVTERSGTGTTNWATGVAAIDINQDGWQDFYICYAGDLDPEKRVHQLFINEGPDKDGIPHFKEEAALYGLNDTSYTTQALFFDYDGDGDADLFLLNHYRSKRNPNFPAKIRNDGSAPGISKLYRNDSRNGHVFFTDVSKQAGITCEGYGLGAAIGDLNGDGWPDLYVSSDFVFNDLLYINNRDGTFTESLAKYIGHTSRFSMGCDIADYNNDGYPDIVEMDMMPDSNFRQKLMNISVNNYSFEYGLHTGYEPQYARNMLQLNQGPDPAGRYAFSEVGQLAGIDRTDWSWTALLADLDNDGWKDLFITNGLPKDITNNDFTAYRETAIQQNNNYDAFKKDLLIHLDKLGPVTKNNFMFKNGRDGRFADSSAAWGMVRHGCSNGAVLADLDNDGDLDIVTNNINAVPAVYRNRSDKRTASHYLRIRLKGDPAYRAGVFLRTAQGQQYSDHTIYRGFQSTQEDILHFGLGKDSTVDTLQVKWGDGRRTRLLRVRADQLLTLDHKDAVLITPAARSGSPKGTIGKASPTPLFTDRTERTGLLFWQVENSFEDFNAEPLLPHRFSRNGPYMAVGDVDGDGYEDFWIGGPAGIPGRLFLQKAGGKFIPKDLPDPGFEDMGGLFFDADGDGDLDLYVVSGGNEYNPYSEPYQDRLYINNGKGEFTRDLQALPVEYASGSCVTANDFDKDGDLDLFIGGRVVPGHYPAAARSFILRNNGKGKFEDVTEKVCPGLGNIGMVTAALWTDFDNDGWTDLMVVGEWMPITLFRNNRGKLEKINFPASFTDSTRGWWFSIAAGDFDEDGDTDYIVGNLGLNNGLRPSLSEPVTVYAGDFNGNGRNLPVLTYFQHHQECTLASRDQLASVIPSIKKKFDTYTKFASASFDKLFPPQQIKDAQVLHATTFASIYLENKGGGRFVLHQLPIPAQISAIQSIQVRDFDRDGHADLLIGGNFYSPAFMLGRNDASIGLFLKGDGHGHFEPQSALGSGIQFRGDVRSLTPIRYGKGPAILVGVNSGPLMLYSYK